MAKFLPYKGLYLSVRTFLTRGIQQSLLKRSQIRINIKNMGDAAHTRLVNMPQLLEEDLWH